MRPVSNKPQQRTNTPTWCIGIFKPISILCAKIIFFFTAAIALGVSCKNDKTSQSEEKASPPIEEVKTNPNNSITAVEKLYTTAEVDTPALFSISCQQNENKFKDFFVDFVLL